MTTFFLNRLAAEPHALAFAGQSTPWPVALADQTTDPSLDEALRGHIAAAGRLLTPVAADLLATTGRPVDLFGFALTADEHAAIDALDGPTRAGHDPLTFTYA